jgi:hypothetical protein
MRRLPWTKFQDFYLRVGFLKVLLVILSPDRRSAARDALIRRIQRPLFAEARSHQALWEQVAGKMTWYADGPSPGASSHHKNPLIAEALLVSADAPSLLFAVTKPTAYKVLDWGHDLELVGHGNQITERGLLLRKLVASEFSDAFLEGDALAWNPFQLSVVEKIAFLYHLLEMDHVTLELINALGETETDKVLESRDAGVLACKALLSVLESFRDSVPPTSIPTFRTAEQLATVIAGELGLHARVDISSTISAPKPPKRSRPARAITALSKASARTAERRTTKNSDHQTIPRFEQLTDFGFLEKAGALEARRRWRYKPTAICRRWASAQRLVGITGQEFLWKAFAKTVVEAFGIKTASSIGADRRAVAEHLWQAYKQVGRPFGHTPLDSVALFAMIRCASRGVVIEMFQFHKLMLEIKQRGELQEEVFFASGNELDKMFILLKPGFPEKIQA